jgi:amino acid transporter
MTPSPLSSRKLSVFDTFCLGLNAIVGSGIFIFPGRLAQEAGPASILAFAGCGLLLVLVALCYAELGSMFHENGGPYVYAKEAFGPGAAFGVGWLSWVCSVFSWAAVANAVSSSLAYFHPFFNQAIAEKGVATLLILGFGLINYCGIKLGAWTIDFFTVAKLVPLLLFVAVGLFFVGPANYRPFWRAGTGSFSYAVFLSLWTLQGFEVTPFPSGESLQPQKAVPIAALGSLLCATLLYVLVQIVAVGVYPGLAYAGAAPLAEASARFMGAAGGTLMAVGAAVSMIGYNAGDALGCPRLLSALAQDRHLPPCLAAPHPRFDTPWAAILITSGLTACAALFLSFESLVDLATLAVISQYVATCGAVIWLRRRRPDAPRLFRIPAGIPVALAGCAVSLWLARQVKLPELLLAAAVLGLGLACTAAFRLARR